MSLGRKNAQLGNGTRVRHRHITTMRPPYQLRTSYNGPVGSKHVGLRENRHCSESAQTALGKREKKRKKEKKKGRYFAASSFISNKTKEEGKKANMVMQILLPFR